MDSPYQVAPARATNRPMRLLVLALSAGTAVAACEGTLIAPTDCGEIPAGGCIDKGSTVDQCEDRSCTALYACHALDPVEPIRGAWEPQRECPARPAPELDASAVDAATEAGRGRSDAAFPPDLPSGAFGGPDCVSLELPDCALAVGYGCTTNCCGCEELFVCANGGWDSWGTCVEHTPQPH